LHRLPVTITVLLALLIAAGTTGSAQMPPAASIDPNVLTAINEQVWIPFCESFARNDGETFLALHTSDAVRVSIDRKDVTSGSAFFERTRARMQRSRDAGRAGTLTLRFTRRTHGTDAAFETGVYRYASQSGDHVGYGRFTVLLRKVDGVWKVALDADEPADAASFEAARPLEDVAWE
jgi:ketosteroid isomerase-like protein